MKKRVHRGPKGVHRPVACIVSGEAIFLHSNIKKASGKNRKSCIIDQRKLKKYNLEIISQVPIVPLKI